jgi:hypothetical protein
VTDELLRAIRTEAAVAIKHWFGVSTHAVWNWRRAFGVQQWGTEGSKRLKKAIDRKARTATTGVPKPPGEMKRRAQVRRNNIGYRYGAHPNDWTAAERALFKNPSDVEVARLTGRTREAVRLKRRKVRAKADGKT